MSCFSIKLTSETVQDHPSRVSFATGSVAVFLTLHVPRFSHLHWSVPNLTVYVPLLPTVKKAIKKTGQRQGLGTLRTYLRLVARTRLLRLNLDL